MTRNREVLLHLRTSARIAWLRFLDRVKPRPGLGGPSPRISVASPAEARRIEEILRRHCNHEWLYHERQPGEDYTGYCEQCLKCGEIAQVPQ